MQKGCQWTIWAVITYYARTAKRLGPTTGDGFFEHMIAANRFLFARARSPSSFSLFHQKFRGSAFVIHICVVYHDHILAMIYTLLLLVSGGYIECYWIAIGSHVLGPLMPFSPSVQGPPGPSAKGPAAPAYGGGAMGPGPGPGHAKEGSIARAT